MTAQLAESEFPARERLKAAQARLAEALTAAKAASDALERGKEQLAHLEKDRDEVAVLVATEAADRARQFEEDGVAGVINAGASRKRRDADDKISSMAATVEILTAKNAASQRAIIDAEAGVKSGIKAVIAEETEPLLCRMLDYERAAAMLRSELRSLQYCGRFGLCADSLPRQLSQEPVNVFHADRPLTWEQQKRYDKCKAGWLSFADALRDNPNAVLSLGD